MEVRRRSRKARRDDSLTEGEGIVGLFAGGLDGYGTRTADLFALTGNFGKNVIFPIAIGVGRDINGSVGWVKPNPLQTAGNHEIQS